MATDEKWYFTKEQLANTPSRKCGIDADKELSYRQQAANLIQDMGQRLIVSQLCINTAIVYMHRFYVFHSLTQFHRNSMASAALFLAAKVEEQPRKLEHVIKVAFMCLHKDSKESLDTKSEQYYELAQDLVFNENVLLQTLGFDVAIDHPHTHVVRCCHLVKANKDLAQTSYFMASNSLHLTTMCLMYKPTIVACFCIHLACKWSNWEIPQSNEGKDWFWYVDKSVTSELLGQLTGEFLHIFDKCPTKLKRKIRSISANQSPNITPSPSLKSPFDVEPRKVQSPANPDGSLNFQSNRSHSDRAESDGSKKSGTSQSARVGYREYQEKKERERLERERVAAAGGSATSSSANADPLHKHHSHHHHSHHKQSSSGMAAVGKHSGAMKQPVHHNHHHAKSSSQMMQRHSSAGSNSSGGGSGAARDPKRENRQNMSREFSSISSGYSSSQNHSMENLLESGMMQDIQTAHPPEKLNNSQYKAHGNADLRLAKPHQQQQQQQKDTKPYAKYADQVAARSSSSSSAASSRKDPIEQRSEEVRKLIEKPLPVKPRPEIQKEEYAAMMLKQSHHPSKYHQPEKPSLPSHPGTDSSGSKMLNVGQTAFTAEKSPNAPVSAAQISQKSVPNKSGNNNNNSNNQAKNGSAGASSFNLLNNIDDLKIEKKPRTDTALVPNPVNKHRSLFSPEKTPTPKEAHAQQRLKQQKQRTSPVVPKLENHASSVFAMDTTKQTGLPNSSNSNSAAPSSSSNAARRANFGLIQPIKDNPLSNDVKPPQLSELVKPFDTKPHQGLTNGLQHSSLAKQPDYSLMDPSSFVVKPELPDDILSNEVPSDFLAFPKQEPKIEDLLSFGDEPTVKVEQPKQLDSHLSPLKSAQGISALLQNVAPTPSILTVPNFAQQPQQSSVADEEKELPSTVDMSALVAPIQCSVVDIPAITTSAPEPVANLAGLPAAPVVGAIEEKKSEHHGKSEKKKKEKKHKHKDKDKSKEKKHKHKDKDKDRHRRDKSDREKDNSKTDDGNGASGNGASLGAVPIKITIPKDKLNLSADSIGASASGTPSSSGSGSSTHLKIKIPKERLKGAGDVAAPQQHQQQQAQSQQQQQLPVQQPQAPQAPLKIKIRTDALARSTTGELQAAPGQLQQLQQQLDGASRKRERSDVTEGVPPTKKLMQQQQQQQRPNERQNGRHGPYSNMTASSNNSKPERFYEAVDVKASDSGEAVEGLPRKFVPMSYGSLPKFYS